MAERRWRIIETTKKVFYAVCEDQKLAERAVTITAPIETTVEKDVSWIDEMNVAHEPTCEGTHCGHYGCQEESDDVPWYCSQCDPGEG